MENILIEGKHGVNFIPTVDFNADTGICELAGESYLEDTIERTKAMDDESVDFIMY